MLKVFYSKQNYLNNKNTRVYGTKKAKIFFKIVNGFRKIIKIKKLIMINKSVLKSV